MGLPTLDTDRLLLRPFEAGDAGRYASWLADPGTVQYLGHGVLDGPAAWRNLAMFVGHGVLRGYTNHAVVVKETGEVVGRCGLWQPEGWPGLEVGWLLGPSARGKGYATEAAAAWRDYALGPFGADELISVVHRDNEASAAVARRIGHEAWREVDFGGLPCVIWGQRR